ncbi:MAG: hypothetical protein DWQ02_02810 [Bacteroidetes bacterium]|nr:MAG: hypothetical protein DWQ02_02810 [Bacteroidota bacterium]
MITVKGKVVPGHGVASGKGNDPRYPQGTLAMQKPFFKERGLDLDQFYRGTINVDISPATFSIKKGRYYFKNINWSSHIPPENFYFFDVTVLHDENRYEGLIYMPDPATKTDHMQNPSVLEVLLREKIEGLETGISLLLEINTEQIKVV